MTYSCHICNHYRTNSKKDLIRHKDNNCDKPTPTLLEKVLKLE